MQKIILISIIVVVVAGGGWLLVGGGNSETNSEIQDTPIAFQEYTPGILDQYRGKPVIANSWAVWCPFCVQELKDFAEIQQEFGDSVVILAINRQESAQRNQEFLHELEVAEDLVYVLDPTDSFYQNMLQGIGMPETIFVNAQGDIHFHKRGPMDAAEIRERLQEML